MSKYLSNEFDNKIKDLNNESVHSLGQCETQESLENWRGDFLGRRGQIALLLREIPKLDPKERGDAGSKANQLKNMLQILFDQKVQDLI